MKATQDDTSENKIKSFKLSKTQPGDWPRGVKVGSSIVKVYRRTRGDGSHGFEVADYTAGRRRLQSCKDEPTALLVAHDLAKKISSGNFEAASMTNREAFIFGRAVEHLKPSGVALDVAAAHFAEAVRILGADKVVLAAQYFVKHSPENLTRRTVAEAVADLLASKASKEENTISDLSSRCKKFAEAFKCDMDTITTSDVQAWLDKMKCSERTKLNYRAKVKQLFTFAERRNYILKGGNPVSDTEKPEPSEGEIEIYTADEITKLLAAASKDFLPCVAIGAFAGLRSSEIQRLTWQDIDFARGHIKASARKRGTPSRRFVPISDNLRAWLQPYVKRKGLVWKPKAKNRKLAEDWFSDAQAETAQASGVAWKHNALRHSFISYRLADVENVNSVALEAGNSAGIIFIHYRELVTKDEAKAWFAIAPQQPSNVVTLKQKAA